MNRRLNSLWSARGDAVAWTFPIIVSIVTLLGLILRIITLRQAWVQIDEPASLLAIEMVTTKGYPLFPADVLYLQGAVFSYLAAPLAWVYSGNDLLDATQWVYLFIALSVVPLSMVLTCYVTSSNTAAALTGILVACDSTLIQWGVAIRRYGFLTAETVLGVYCFVKLLGDGKDARIAGVRSLYWISILGFIGTFTHIGFWLVIPGLYLVAMIHWKWLLLTANREILISGAIPLLGPVAFVILGKYVGLENSTGGTNTMESFVGTHLFSVKTLFDSPAIRWTTWTNSFNIGSFHESIPFMVFACSGVLALQSLTIKNPGRATSLTAVLCSHWAIVLIVTIFVPVDPKPRYLIQALPLGYVIIGSAAAIVWQLASSHQIINRTAVTLALVILLIFPTVSNSVTAANWRMDQPGYDNDYWHITEWVGENYEGGQYVLTTLPPAAYFWFSKEIIENYTYFLAGPDGSNRARRYVKTHVDGFIGDYWLGIPPIGTVASLCTILRDYAGNAWIIIDRTRLDASWSFKGDMANVILGTTEVRYQGPDRSLALFVRPVSEWDAKLTSRCS